MYDEYEFTEQFMRDMIHNFERYVEANRNHIKGLECKVDILEKQHDELQVLVEMLRKENEALKAYIKSGEKIIKLEKDFTDDTNGSI